VPLVKEAQIGYSAIVTGPLLAAAQLAVGEEDGVRASLEDRGPGDLPRRGALPARAGRRGDRGGDVPDGAASALTTVRSCGENLLDKLGVSEGHPVAGGLVALLDDVAVLARAAAASVDDIGAAAARASLKATGVVVDDTAVTPQYVHGLAAEREVPIIRRIALGSLRNKMLIILPAILVLSQFLPWALTPLLMLGGAYLCYEGAEKVWGRIRGHEHGHGASVEGAMPDEDTIVSGAVRTDFILSAEIMVISLNEVADESFASRARSSSSSRSAITVLVYGVVALIVKMDDVGLRLAERPGRAGQRRPRLVKGMPKLLTALTVIGTAAMLWVGGHILLVGMHDLGVDALYDAVHHLEDAAKDATGALGGVVKWLVDTSRARCSGLAVGGLLVLVMSLTLHRGEGRAQH
jgi:predicted DNA repair protein MutK